MKEFKVTFKRKDCEYDEIFDYFLDSYPADEYTLDDEGDRLDLMVFYGESADTMERWIAEQQTAETQYQLDIRELPEKEWKKIKARLD